MCRAIRAGGGGGRSRACPGLVRAVRLYEALLAGGQAVVSVLGQEGLTSQEQLLRALPLGLALPLQEALLACRRQADQPVPGWVGGG